MQSAFEKHQEQQKRDLRGVFCVARFKPGSFPGREALRARLLGLHVKLLLLLGRGVVVVGRTGSGKNYLLDRTLPGRVIAPDRRTVIAGQRPALDMQAIPQDGMFAIDEPTYFDENSLADAFESLKKRKVVFTVQQLAMVHTLNLTELFKDRLHIIYLGSQKEYLTERSQPVPRSPANYSPYRIVTAYQNIDQLRSSNDSDK